jgi:transposase
MGQTAGSFSLATLERKKLEKFRHKERDARIHNRLSALLWLADGHSAEEVATLLDVCPRTISNWLALYQAGGLDTLCSLEYKGDPG